MPHTLFTVALLYFTVSAKYALFSQASTDEHLTFFQYSKTTLDIILLYYIIYII